MSSPPPLPRPKGPQRVGALAAEMFHHHAGTYKKRQWWLKQCHASPSSAQHTAWGAVTATPSVRARAPSSWVDTLDLVFLHHILRKNNSHPGTERSKLSILMNWCRQELWGWWPKKSWGGHVPGSAQAQVGWGLEEPALVQGVPSHDKRLEWNYF